MQGFIISAHQVNHLTPTSTHANEHEHTIHAATDYLSEQEDREGNHSLWAQAVLVAKRCRYALGDVPPVHPELEHEEAARC